MIVIKALFILPFMIAIGFIPFMVISQMLFGSVTPGVVLWPVTFIGLAVMLIDSTRKKQAALKARVQADIDSRKRQLIHETPVEEWGIVDLDNPQV